MVVSRHKAAYHSFFIGLFAPIFVHLLLLDEISVFFANSARLCVLCVRYLSRFTLAQRTQRRAEFAEKTLIVTQEDFSCKADSTQNVLDARWTTMLYNSTTSYPETAKPLLGLAEELLRGPSSLTSAERELIATYARHRTTALFA